MNPSNSFLKPAEKRLKIPGGFLHPVRYSSHDNCNAQGHNKLESVYGVGGGTRCVGYYRNITLILTEGIA